MTNQSPRSITESLDEARHAASPAVLNEAINILCEIQTGDINAGERYAQDTTSRAAIELLVTFGLARLEPATETTGWKLRRN